MVALPLLLLAGAVRSCGALLVLSGAAKLYRASRRAPDGGGAIRAALRISSGRWRLVEPAAGVVEAATGVAVCFAFHPVASGIALAVLGAVFGGLLAYARREKAGGGCACVRRSKDPNAAIGWPVQVRAAWLLLAGVIEALVRLPRPVPQAGAAGVVGLAGVSTLILMVGAEGLWHGALCRFPIGLGRRTSLSTLMEHGVFEAMAGAVGPFAEGFVYRREGCIEEFRFAALPRANRADRVVAFRVGRTVRGSGLAVEARIVGGVLTGGARRARDPRRLDHPRRLHRIRAAWPP